MRLSRAISQATIAIEATIPMATISQGPALGNWVVVSFEPT